MKAASVVLACALAAIVIAQNPQHADKSSQWKIEGQVTGDAGPVSGAAISASGPERLADVLSDPKGHYVLAGTGPGNYSISASKEGTAEPTPKSITVLPGSHLESIDFRLGKESVIAGRVLNPDKSAVPSITVGAFKKTFVRGRLRLTQKEYARTDDRGEYRIRVARPGEYYLMIVPPPLTPHPRLPSRRNETGSGAKRAMVPARAAFYPSALSFDGAAPIALHAGEERQGVDVVLPRVDSYCAAMTLVSQNNHSSVRIPLQLFQAIVGSFPTIARGFVMAGQPSELCGLAPGDYTAIATSADQTGQVGGFVRAGFTITQRDVDLGTLRPAPPIPLRGRIMVVGPSAEGPVPNGLHVSLEHFGRPTVYGESTNAPVETSGIFVFERALADEYAVAVSGLPAHDYIRTIAQQGRDVTRGGIRPEGGELSITMDTGGLVVGGKIVDDDNRPVPDATVILVPQSGSYENRIFSRQSDQRGGFEFASCIPPVDYEIVAFRDLLDGQEQDPEFIRMHLSGATKVDAAPSASISLTLHAQTAR